MFTIALTIFTFVVTVVLIMWRPKGLNVSIPALAGAGLMVISGAVSLHDMKVIASDVGGASVTIMATIAMALVLESFGVFQYVADFLARLSKNSGKRLFWYISLMSLLMTLVFNNDGAIIIATPIIIILLRKLGLKPHQQIPYLLSAALVDTAASAPLGVSNIVNLISIKIIGMSLATYSEMIFVPSMIGVGVLAVLNYVVFRKKLVIDLKQNRLSKKHKPKPGNHPFGPNFEAAPAEIQFETPSKKQKLFMRNILIYVLAIRVALFVGADFGISPSITAVVGAGILLIWRWIKMGTSPIDIIRKTPWHVLFFAFGMYVVGTGIANVGLNSWLVHQLQPFIERGWFSSIAATGIAVSLMSDLFNNHPALMIGTLNLTSMHMSQMDLHVAYLGNIIGSDIGSLLMPIGLLATLIWMFVLKQYKVHISWAQYLRVTTLVIPPTVIATVVLCYAWVRLIYG
ncbi:ArsB/NhaD family transporter [Bacillus sp. AFS017336]|uniref:ArsB/NhaD family transporter n=1 Tax=Bacillus sp. AFS017336 TaxID=2033489 RepID=UPI000BEF533D|nr:ArsB/NhaD family transporter [Bacillus sp. AFS017336]PEL07668.1 arsenic transporter [Bacillus sp. AFS017336]